MNNEEKIKDVKNLILLWGVVCGIGGFVLGLIW